MRLSKREIELIKKQVQTVFGDVVVYLFGSRADDSKKGGDVDLYIVTNAKENLFRKKLRLKTRLEDALYKPVDIIVSTNKERLIEKEAMKGIQII